MAVYRTNPTKDATIYTYHSSSNTGLDEIVELRNTYIRDGYYITRILTNFDHEEIDSIISSYVGTSSYDVRCKYYMVNAANLPLNCTFEAYALSQSWDMGTGKYLDEPVDESGVSWYNRKAGATEAWNVPGGDYISSSKVEASASYSTATYDLDFNVTDIVNEVLTGSYNDNGILIKLTGSLELSETELLLQYFSYDSTSIFTPVYEVRWQDVQYSTGSLSEVDVSSMVINTTNLPNKLEEGEILEVRLRVRPRYPVKRYTTSSMYRQNYVLPENSYYAIQELSTGEMIIPFSEYTKVSADSDGSYFTIYSNGLQPENYYTIYVKSSQQSKTNIKEVSQPFKVVV